MDCEGYLRLVSGRALSTHHAVLPTPQQQALEPGLGLSGVCGSRTCGAEGRRGASAWVPGGTLRARVPSPLGPRSAWQVGVLGRTPTRPGTTSYQDQKAICVRKSRAQQSRTNFSLGSGRQTAGGRQASVWLLVLSRGEVNGLSSGGISLPCPCPRALP